MFLRDVSSLLHGQIPAKEDLKEYYCQCYTPGAYLEVCLGGGQL